MFEFLTTPTALYLDPTSVSILLTSISGVAIAISATVVILWRKAKKKVTNVLHIDENANKEELCGYLKKGLKNYFYKRTKQSPLIIVSVVEV